MKTQLRLLIIDIKSDRSKFRILENSFEVLYAPDLNTGLTHAVEYMPALLIVNSFFAHSDFRSSLKKSFRTSRIPVLGIMGEGQLHDGSLDCIGGCDDFLQSPFGKYELLLRVRLILLNRAHFHERYVNFDPAVNADNDHECFLQRIKNIIEENLDNTLFGVKELAGEACVSQPQLYRKLVALTGFSPNSYIRHIRLTHAARLLSSGAGNVGEIAFRVGFSSQSYFAKCFKAVHQYTPKRSCAPVSVNRLL